MRSGFKESPSGKALGLAGCGRAGGKESVVQAPLTYVRCSDTVLQDGLVIRPDMLRPLVPSRTSMPTAP